MVIGGIGLDQLLMMGLQRRENQILIFADQLAVTLQVGSKDGRELWFVLPFGHGSLPLDSLSLAQVYIPGSRASIGPKSDV